MVNLCSLTKRIVFNFQNSVVVFSCLLAAVSASPQYYYPQYQRQVYSPYGGVAPAAAVVPVVPTAPGAPVTAALTPELTSQLKGLANVGAPHFTTALAKLGELMTSLPAVLSTLEPSKKADIVKTNQIIADVCGKVIAEAQPTYYSNYQAGDMQKVCDYINKVGADITAGLDNPAIFQTYFDQLKTISNALIAQA